MLTLLTGAPGSGKSALMVKWMGEAVEKGRPVFVYNVPDLTLPHTVLDPERWHIDCPDGALVVLDEAQGAWRPAGTAAKVPDHIAKLETHRHHGLDFIIITQHPGLIHGNVRKLIGRHVHLRDLGILGRWWYEWPETGNPERFRDAPHKVRYRLPKAVFGQYKSASLHVKPVRSIPRPLIVLCLVVPLLLFLAWRMYSSIKAKIAPSTPTQNLERGQPGATVRTMAVAIPPFQAIAQREAAVIGDRPETAPQFDHLRVVVAFPRIVGGFCRSGKCRCFTQQATDPGVSQGACAAWIASPPFNVYHADHSERGQQATQAPPQDAPSPQPVVSGLERVAGVVKGGT